MNIIIPSLKLGDSGPSVGNLQDALLALLERKTIQVLDAPNRPTAEDLQKLAEGLKQERDQAQFGNATQQFIMYFQVQQGLGDNLRGVVEDTTAVKLNELLKSIGALDDDTSLIVRGTVKTADGQPIGGASVIAFDRDMRKLQEFAKAETNVLGEFVISYHSADFASGDAPSAQTPKLIVRAFVGDQQIGDDVSRPHPDRIEIVNFEAPAPVVSEWEKLSAAVLPLLEGQGKDDQALPPWEVNDGDLDFIAEETGLEREHIRLWALAFVVGRDAAAVMQPATVPGMATHALSNLVITDGLSAFAIFYGWFRLGLPTEPVPLWATPTETLLTTLRSAVAQGVVPSNIGADLGGLSKRIEQIKLDRVLQAPTPGTTACLSDLLATSPLPLSPDQQRVVAGALTDLRPDDPQLHEQIAKLPGLDGPDVAAGIARTLRLGALTAGHLPLTKALQQRLENTDKGEGSLRPLAALRPDEWLDLAYTHGTPDGITITPVAYADALAASVERLHPTAALTAHFTDGRRLAQHPVLADVGTFLSDNTEFDIVTANLNAVTDQAKLGGIPEPEQAQLVAGLRSLQRMNGLGATWDETAVLLESDLYSPHQLLMAGPTQLATRLDGRIAPERAAALYHQAEDLHSTTLAAFTAGFSPLSAPRIMPTMKFSLPPTGVDGPGGGIPPVNPPPVDPTGKFTLDDLADAVSHHLASRDTALNPGWGRVMPPPRTGIVIPDSAAHLDLGPVINQQPTLQALFGSQDGCACEHCDSVLGPAAYFVDMLEFIREANLESLLMGRRPDLQDLELSCNNTETEVPAIDLVLEILENAVALELPVELKAGTRIEDQLNDGLPVGGAVRDALKQTVRDLPDEVIVRASRDSLRSNTWTVVDGHRRWKITAQPEGMVMAGTTPLITNDVAALIAGLDQGHVASGAEAAFAGLFAVNQTPPPDFANYAVTITPLTKGKSWRVEYQFVGQLVTVFDVGAQIVLQTPAGGAWWDQTYSQATAAAVKADLASGTVPELVQRLVASRFAKAPALTVTPVSANTVAITSGKSALTLIFAPARLNITALTYQSGDPDADPIAWPENHNPAAYAKLRGVDAVFPWSLPVDLPWEEVRLFLERARSSRRSLIELTTPVNPPPGNDAVLAREVLGLSKAEADLIGAENADPAIFACWGVTLGQLRIWDAAAGGFLIGPTTLSLLQNVSILLQQSRLSFEELQAVLAMRFVQGRAAPLVITPDNTCKPSEMTVAGLAPGHLDRIHRFVRLQRRLGWSAQDLDTAIQVITDRTLDDTTLLKLADLVRLQESLDLPVAAILAWYGAGALDDQDGRLLAQALGLTSSELTHALALFEVAKPFASPADTLGLCERVKAFQRSGVAFEDLRYLLHHVKTPGSNVTLDEEKQLPDLAAAALDAVRSVPEGVEKVPPLTAADRLDNDKVAQATRIAQENSVLAALATALNAERELVDDLLRARLLDPAHSGRPAIDVFFGQTSDIIDPSSLVAKMRNSPDPLSISAYLWKLFSPADQRVLSDPAANASQQATILAATLNPVLQGVSIYEVSRFAGVKLSAETAALNSLTPPAKDDDLIRLNRLLLEDAYPLEITKCRLSDMTFVAGEVPQPDGAAVKSVLVRLYKAAWLSGALKFGRVDLALVQTSATAGSGFTALDFNTLPVTSTEPAADVARCEQLLALAQLRNIARGAGDLLAHYAAIDFGPAGGVSAAQSILATGFELGAAEVAAAAAQLHLTLADHRDPVELTRLIELLAALKQLGATVGQATDLSGPAPADATALSARELLHSKYGDSQWHDLIKPIADQLRERQRDALVDYLIGQNARPRDGDANSQIYTGPRLRDADDLYEHYLIDVQIGSCLKTTRLLLATAAAQLFVQRVLLNLEEGASLDDSLRARWDWMHNYRVWEANRKVFLFPENWLLPELRDDKTATFRQMESALTEKEASPEITRSALLGYLEELGDLAQISVIAMYQAVQIIGEDKDGKEIVEQTLYVVGRTPDQPYRYYWRSCAKFGSGGMSWTGWEALDLDNANDFILPFVMEGDLHVAWPIFSKTKDEKDENKLRWEVQIAWTRRTNKGWVKRKISHAQLRVNRLENKDAAGSFVFRLSKVDSQVIIGSANNKLLTREVIEIACYSADEAIPILAIEPDPDLDVFTHTGGNADTLWNAKLTVSGVFYQYATGDTAENTRKNLPVSGAVVTLFYSSRTSENTFNDVKEYSNLCTTNGDGTFNFSIDTQSDDKAGVYRDSTIRLSFMWFDGDLKQFDGPSRVLGPENHHYFQSWTWNVNVGLKNDKLQKLFLPDRQVKYVKAGRFIIESGRDLRLDPQPGLMLPLDPAPSLLTSPANVFVKMSVDGNRFISTSGGKRVGLGGYQFNVDHDFGPQLEITLSADASGYKSRLWFVRDASGRYYVRMIATIGLSESFWKVWPDGQDFVGWYRRVAAASTFALFDPAKQAMTRDGQQALLPAPPAQPDSTSSPSISFERTSPYANYNWELFLHAPLVIADYLASQQRFEDARRWLHAVFDPTTGDKNERALPQFWRFLPFVLAERPRAIAKLLTWLADPTVTDAEDTQAIEDDLSSQIAEWKRDPFMPHLIARLRPSAYQWHTVFAYLDVLIGWGDQLFRRDTRESVNDATLLYVLAAKLLGPRPRVIPAPTPPYALTYRLLPRDGSGDLDDFSNAWVDYADLPGVKQLFSAQMGSPRSSQSFPLLKKSDQPSDHVPIPIPDTSSAIPHLASLSALAFCIPQNEKVTEFYDRVEDRLFNVRNCRNIDGVFRDLPLYDPPIDPLLLIRARAAGLDIDSVIADLYAPLPNYRFTFTLQKALELTAELKALGGALLTALEKKDAEELTLLRSSHEIAMLKLVRDTRKQQIAEAEANITALQQSEETILERFGQYQKLLGKPGITKGQDGLPVVEQSSSLAVSTDAVGEGSGLGLIRKEVDQLGLVEAAHIFTQAANSGNILAGVLSLIPNIWAGGIFAGQTFGGTNLGNAAGLVAKSIEMAAAQESFLANRMGTFGGYERRQDEWVHQSNLALAELKQIQKQIVAAEIRKDIAERELSNHDTQIENAQEIEAFMRSKFTSQQLYRWMSSQIAEVYFRTYQLALDQARRTERAYQHELGVETTTTPFVQAGNWDSLKRGLLAGEHLHHDLKRMESAYLERNVREFEITKHISLLQLDPGALIKLRQSFTCDFDLPEVLFDLDYPGHYMRRIKMVSLSIPCVVGPYAGVSATLKLTKNEIRAKPTGSYERLPEPADDPRFMKTAATITAVVTSTAQQDSGMFEPNLRDERYLPFEGAGVISTWRIELPSAFRAFDYDSIADVVLHVRYTARNSDELKAAAEAPDGLLAAIKSFGVAAGKSSLTRLFSLRQEFPTEWHQFIGGTNSDPTVDPSQLFAITNNRFPFLFAGKQFKILSLDLYALPKTGVEISELPPLTVTPPGNVTAAWGASSEIGRLRGKTLTLANPVAVADGTAKWKLEISQGHFAEFRQDIDDILVVCHYSVS